MIHIFRHKDFRLVISGALFFGLLFGNIGIHAQPQSEQEKINPKVPTGDYSKFSVVPTITKKQCIADGGEWVEEEEGDEIPLYTDDYFESKPAYKKVIQKKQEEQTLWGKFVNFLKESFRAVINGVKRLIASIRSNDNPENDTFADRYRETITKRKEKGNVEGSDPGSEKPQVTVIKSRGQTLTPGPRTHGATSGKSPARRRGGG
jgi:hypothetical protein